MGVVFPRRLTLVLRRMGRRATRMVARFEGFDLIMKFMFLSFKYTGHSFLSPE
jgi:hypothetical protein